MTDHDHLFTIGELARVVGVSARTIRFWSDEGLIPPTARSSGGYRLFDAHAAARIDMVRTLRELGLDLSTVQAVLDRQVDLAAVAAAHAEALDAEIRTLRVRRAVLRSVAQRNSTAEEMRIMHEMAMTSAAERQRIIDEFVDATFSGIDDDAPGAHIGVGMRSMPATLPDDPSPAQVDAWIELVELVADNDFRARCREMALTGSQAGRSDDLTVDLTVGAAALDAGVDTFSPEAADLLAASVPEGTDRAALATRLATFTDARVERYWTLLGILNGWPPRPPTVPGAQWLISALRAHP